jgi:hypothetical protein
MYSFFTFMLPVHLHGLALSRGTTLLLYVHLQLHSRTVDWYRIATAHAPSRLAEGSRLEHVMQRTSLCVPMENSRPQLSYAEYVYSYMFSEFSKVNLIENSLGSYKSIAH